MAVLAVADLYGISGRRQELLEVLAQAERAAVARPGCRRYAFATTLAEPDRFVLVSEWDDAAALDAHYASQEFARFQFALQGMLARPSEMRIYSVSSEVRPLASEPMDPRDAD